MKKHISLSTPTMHDEEMKFIQEAFDKNWIAPLGFNVDAFENEVCEYLKEDVHALAVASGTAAIHLAVKLAGVQRGDVVLCSDMTFAASVNPVVYEGATPVFIDAERDTWNMDPKALEKALKKYPGCKAVVMVHLYGTPCKAAEIQEICDRHGVRLIEDAAESLAATYRGRQTGLFGDYGIFSFNGNKIITTSGGGMLITKTAKERDKAFFWSTQARDKAYWYQHSEIGYNYRMSNVVAGIGRGQLVHLEEHRAAKKAIYDRYKELLAGLPLGMNPFSPQSEPNFWLSCVLLDEDVQRSPVQLLEFLKDNDIETRPIWKPMHMQPVFAGCDFVSAADRPVDEDIFARGLCLPSDIKMTPDEQTYVAGKIKEFLLS